MLKRNCKLQDNNQDKQRKSQSFHYNNQNQIYIGRRTGKHFVRISKQQNYDGFPRFSEYYSRRESCISHLANQMHHLQDSQQVSLNSPPYPNTPSYSISQHFKTPVYDRTVAKCQTKKQASKQAAMGYEFNPSFSFSSIKKKYLTQSSQYENSTYNDLDVILNALGSPQDNNYENNAKFQGTQFEFEQANDNHSYIQKQINYHLNQINPQNQLNFSFANNPNEKSFREQQKNLMKITNEIIEQMDRADSNQCLPMFLHNVEAQTEIQFTSQQCNVQQRHPYIQPLNTNCLQQYHDTKIQRTQNCVVKLDKQCKIGFDRQNYRNFGIYESKSATSISFLKLISAVQQYQTTINIHFNRQEIEATVCIPSRKKFNCLGYLHSLHLNKHQYAASWIPCTDLIIWLRQGQRLRNILLDDGQQLIQMHPDQIYTVNINNRFTISNQMSKFVYICFRVATTHHQNIEASK